jgi:PD-(D/E)XK nuclease superfamily protein
MQISKMHQLSWSKVNLFLQCACCFYKEQVLKMKRPGFDPDSFSLNNLIDALLKNEFDEYRKEQKPHPIMIEYKINAVPFMHNSLPLWRSYKGGGIRFCDDVNDIELFGLVDDVWINEKKELMIVDYKTTARKGSIDLNLSNNWNSTNRRQASFYAYLLHKHGFQINSNGYFLFCIADNNTATFCKRLDFRMSIITYQLDYSWIEGVIKDIRNCLDQKFLPIPNGECVICNFTVKK